MCVGGGVTHVPECNDRLQDLFRSLCHRERVRLREVIPLSRKVKREGSMWLMPCISEKRKEKWVSQQIVASMINYTILAEEVSGRVKKKLRWIRCWTKKIWPCKGASARAYIGWHWLKRYGNCFPWVWLLERPVQYFRIYFDSHSKKGLFTHSLSSHWSAVHSAVVLYVTFVHTEEPAFRPFGSDIWRADPMTESLGFRSYYVEEKVN